MNFITTVTDSQPQAFTIYIHNDLITQNNGSYTNLSWYQLNFQLMITTLEMGFGGKYITTFLDILNIPVIKSNIVNCLLEVLENIIGLNIQEMDHKAINKNS